MKKVLLTGTALLAFAAASFAQGNSATTNQNGNAQTASQMQTGNYLKSTVTQTQGSSTNYGNFGATEQTSTGPAGNQATVAQTNGANSDRAYVTQTGGTGNVGTITQDQASGKGNLQVTASTSSADVINAGGNWGGIYQQGSNNKDTYINQNSTSSSNFGEIYQYGSNSRQTSIDQSNNSNRNTAKVNQGAADAPISNGRVVVSQQNNSQSNDAYVTQLASGNDAVVTQNGGNLGNSNNNKATVNQTGGSGSTATVEQQNYSFDNIATVTQQRSNNTGSIEQSNASAYNTASIMQMGVQDIATIKQTDYTAYNTASIAQNGSSNQASIEQVNEISYNGQGKATISQDLGSTAGFGNVAAIKQGELGVATSERNTATITQNYSQNAARLLQVGSDNTGTFTQTGDRNIIRAGDAGADSFALQRGNSNTLTVSQDSGGSAPYVPNVANVSQIGNGNAATIMQTGRN